MEKSLLLIRQSDNDKVQTLGEMFVLGATHPIIKTVELEYNDNKKRISCIPIGTYIVKKRTSPKYGNHFHIQDVPNRDYILIHACNYSRQLLGCIGVGQAHIDINKDGLKDITNSKATLAALYDVMPDTFKLVIK